jgi:ribosomal protein L22
MTDDPRKDEELEPAEEAAAEVESDEAKVEEVETPEAQAGEAPAAEVPDDDVEAAEAEVESDEAKVEDEPAAAGAPAEKPKRSRRRRQPAAEEAAEAEAEDDAAEAPAGQAAPTRRRDRRRAADPGVMVRAQARYVRTSARKARLVCDHIRGKDVEEARAILAFTPRGAAKAWSKLLDSAVANAEHNHELVGEELRIASVYADEGPTLKRFRPRAMGRATRIRKRTSHLTITLTPKG